MHTKFFYIICNQYITEHKLGVIRQNMEEIVMQGSDGSQDVRIVNSYPSKVNTVYSKTKGCSCLSSYQKSSPGRSSHSAVISIVEEVSP